MFEEKEIHLAAARTKKRVNREGRNKRGPPMSKRTKEGTFRRMDSRNKAGFENRRGTSNRRVVNAIVANHLEMLVGDMNNKTFNEIHNRNSFGNKFVIFVPVVMKGNKRAGIRVDA